MISIIELKFFGMAQFFIQIPLLCGVFYSIKKQCTGGFTA